MTQVQAVFRQGSRLDGRTKGVVDDMIELGRECCRKQISNKNVIHFAGTKQYAELTYRYACEQVKKMAKKDPCIGFYIFNDQFDANQDAFLITLVSAQALDGYCVEFNYRICSGGTNDPVIGA